MTYFSAQQRLWLVGPIALMMFWFYCFAVTRTGAVRVFVGLPFMATNALFNLTCGSIIFWELPREVFFTDRLKRQKISENAQNAKVAAIICAEMNKADPGHC